MVNVSSKNTTSITGGNYNYGYSAITETLATFVRKDIQSVTNFLSQPVTIVLGFSRDYTQTVSHLTSYHFYRTALAYRSSITYGATSTYISNYGARAIRRDMVSNGYVQTTQIRNQEVPSTMVWPKIDLYKFYVTQVSNNCNF